MAAHNFISLDGEANYNNKISLSSSFLNSQKSEAVLDLAIKTKHFNGYSYICNDVSIPLVRKMLTHSFLYIVSTLKLYRLTAFLEIL